MAEHITVINQTLGELPGRDHGTTALYVLRHANVAANITLAVKRYAVAVLTWP